MKGIKELIESIKDSAKDIKEIVQKIDCVNCYYACTNGDMFYCSNPENSALSHFQTPLEYGFGCVNIRFKYEN